MKIKNKNPWELEVFCKECESTMILEVSDVKGKRTTWSNDAYGYSSEDSFWTKCGVCNSRVTIKEDSIPSGIRELVLKKKE